MHVLIRAFDDVPEHVLELHTIEDGLVTGMALTGPLAGEYGEPDIELVLRVLSADSNGRSQGTA
jgi:hypothetical protein